MQYQYVVIDSYQHKNVCPRSSAVSLTRTVAIGHTGNTSHTICTVLHTALSVVFCPHFVGLKKSVVISHRVSLPLLIYTKARMSCHLFITSLQGNQLKPANMPPQGGSSGWQQSPPPRGPEFGIPTPFSAPPPFQISSKLCPRQTVECEVYNNQFGRTVYRVPQG